MSKKLIALLIAVAVLLSIGAVALATGATGSGGIKFNPNSNEGVHDPDCCICLGQTPKNVCGNRKVECNHGSGCTAGREAPCKCKCHKANDDCCGCKGKPPEGGCTCPCHPKDTVKRQLGSMAIDFGEQEISGTNATYNSLTQARKADLTPYPAAERTFNDNRSPLRAAGFLVESTTNDWQVTLTIQEFKVGSTTTLTGFSLRLIPGLFQEAAVQGQQAQVLGGTGTWLGEQTYAAAVNDTLGASSTADKPKLKKVELQPTIPQLVATGKAGISGGNFAGELFVPGGTARAGDAKAIMTWTYTAGTPQ